MFSFLDRYLPTTYEKRMTALVAMIVLVVGVSLTARLTETQQDNRQRANEVSTPLNAPISIAPQTPTTAPTVTIDPLATPVSVSVSLNGVANPVNTTRNFTLDVYDSNNTLVLSQTSPLTFRSGTYTGIINLTNLQTGSYILKLHTPGFLENSTNILPRPIEKGQNLTLSSVTLTPGDINNDGTINSLDYNLLNDCYEGLTPAKSCTDPLKKESSDLNADGKVDQIDYNIILRNIK